MGISNYSALKELEKIQEYLAYNMKAHEAIAMQHSNKAEALKEAYNIVTNRIDQLKAEETK